tara:strand:- start:198 stop:353 length:156 start_codon:yes stop_codon:yes gene_type:complete
VVVVVQLTKVDILTQVEMVGLVVVVLLMEVVLEQGIHQVLLQFKGMQAEQV